MEYKLGYLLSWSLLKQSGPYVGNAYTILALNLQFSYCTEPPHLTLFQPPLSTILEHYSSNISVEPVMTTYQRDHMTHGRDEYYVV